MMKNIDELFEQLLENELFRQDLMNVHDVAALQNLFEKYDIPEDEDVSWEELYKVFQESERLSRPDDELSENDLENVAGGGKHYKNYCNGFWDGQDGNHAKGQGICYNIGYAVGSCFKWAKK